MVFASPFRWVLKFNRVVEAVKKEKKENRKKTEKESVKKASTTQKTKSRLSRPEVGQLISIDWASG
ncbi:MAG: hypothetical protein A2664_00465 [Candidatus Taylorbacteria bacterium RIFCSPHIGHO2_01_FULL_46_22b]|uniref:Uncharacterized protein n=1 Tax=Candidatus Taylorbacteria bacterium RIFCSPHIGHO2_01_FULL_46_22b TaxID=1802301 RepID=A0A1G2M4S3_9BACT|nr:MAG: hypothetical protein A2664_00465 [Candidatus Taylorbacteria bacterium RIFCSPHIGHO2_01_FULL_46_22b]